MVDEHTEQIVRTVVRIADRAVARYRVFAGRRHAPPVADLLRGLVEEARQRAAEVDRAYFRIVGRPPGRVGDDGGGVEAAGLPTDETSLLKRALGDFQEVHVLVRTAALKLAPGLARRALLDLAKAEETRIAAFAAVYRSKLVPAAKRADTSRLPQSG